MTGRGRAGGGFLPPRLRALGVPARVLATGFLLGTGGAFLAGHVNLHFAHSGADGTPGLSMEDLRRTFHGRPGWSLLASKIDGGSMEKHVPLPSERETLLAWAAAGAGREEFADARRVIDRRCIRCHAPDREKADRPFTRSSAEGASWDLVRVVCTPDTGVGAPALARSTHAHLFGFSLLLLGLGGAFLMSDAGRRMKTTVVSVAFLAMYVDVGCWWLAKLHPAFCWGIVAGGALMALAVAYILVRCLWELWGPRPALLDV